LRIQRGHTLDIESVLLANAVKGRVPNCRNWSPNYSVLVVFVFTLVLLTKITQITFQSF
jgi:hypothetical protein